jgi:hypothetical protein
LLFWVRDAVLGGALALAAASPGVAQSWGDVGGPPVTYGRPPAAYAMPVYRSAPPAPPLSPAAVFDALQAAGYREFSPMAPRGAFYKLDAVNRRGDLVALVVSAFTGEIAEERVLAFHPGSAPSAPPQPVPQSAPAAAAAPPPAPVGNGHNPLVVY